MEHTFALPDRQDLAHSNPSSLSRSSSASASVPHVVDDHSASEAITNNSSQATPSVRPHQAWEDFTSTTSTTTPSSTPGDDEAVVEDVVSRQRGGAQQTNSSSTASTSSVEGVVSSGGNVTSAAGPTGKIKEVPLPTEHPLEVDSDNVSYRIVDDTLINDQHQVQ